MNNLNNRKMENQNENNINETEMIINVNEDANKIDNFEVNHATERKRENSPFSKKFIDVEYNHIQFENVVIKTEREDQFFEENFDKPAVNQDEIKSVVNQNNINLMDRTIKKENKNQDFQEQLLEKFDNTLETFDSKNDDMKIKVEENYDYSSYLKIYPYDPLTNQDEIKIDIVNNEIESVNVEKNINYKSEDIEESLDHALSLEDEDKTDRDASSCLTIIKEVSTGKLSKLQDKGNQKVKKISDHKIINPGSKQLECTICDKKYSVLTNLRYHMRTHTGDKPFECSVCQKKFTRSDYLKQHMRTHTGEKSSECSICHKKFTQVSHLSEHMRIHTGEKPYECSVCQKKFTKLSHMKYHMIKTHTEEKPNECNVCQKKFIRPSSLREHMRIHTGEKPYECEVCHKKFTQLSHMKHHIIIHTGEKSNECSVCQKKFTRASSLKTHLKIHTDEKRHECSVCQKKFMRPIYLKLHMRIHTGEKPYECSVCQKKFSQFSTLREHKKIHTGEKLQECSVCQKTFIRPVNLSTHMKLHKLKIKSNVVQKLQRKHCEEPVEESVDNLLLSKGESEIDGSQNNVKLTVSALKKENEHLDSEEHSQESFKNILKTCTSNDMETKVEEIYDYPLYLEKSPDDPLMNLDEIKLDIVDNDIDSVNTEIYVSYKSEDMENF